jgi:transcriptional regulator with XRE-family HTH domain
MSQEQFASKIGAHRTYVGHIERGETNPTMFDIVRIASGLEVDLGELMSDLDAWLPRGEHA